MKIGILTYHRAHNYGALLQAYALQTYLRGLGHNTEMIDYWPDYHAKTYDLLPDFMNSPFKSKIKILILFLLGFNRIISREKSYKQFMSTYLGLETTAKYKTPEELSDVEYDIVVYGSDQIWWKSSLPTFKGYDLVYWGNQPSKAKRKITYAPSMGVMNYDKEDLKLLERMMGNFDSISVRENTLKELLETKMGCNSTLVLDPTFLLDKLQWEKLCDSRPAPINFKEKYVFFYQLMRNDDASRLVDKVAKHYNCRVIEIRGRVDSLKFGKRYQQTIDPIGFVQLIRNAHFVISTSFHGTAFSIIFEKQFFATGMGKNSERAKSLLKSIYLEKRYIEDGCFPSMNEAINYAQINPAIEHN